MPESRCDLCEWWQKVTADEGNCRRRHPIVLINRDIEQYVTRWPETGEDQWCGEFKAKTGE